MSFLYLAGLESNLITQSGASLTSSSADANFPVTNLQGDYVWKPFRFNAAGTNDSITVDLGSAQSVGFSSIHYHNVDSGVTALQLRRSTDNFASSNILVGTFTVAEPSMYLNFASVSTGYWGLSFVGTNANPIIVGKWVLGVESSLTEEQLSSWSIGYEQAQVSPRPGVPINLADQQRRSLDMSFIAKSDAAVDEVVTMLRDSKYGAEPLVIVPDSNESSVYYGRVPSTHSIQRTSGGQENSARSLYRYSLRLEEDPLPVVVN